MTTPEGPPRVRRIGLTGGIGSGKSMVASMLVERGAILVDTDAIAHELTRAGGTAMPAVEARFGRTVVRSDGALDRDAMRELAFADPAAKQALEQILHPLIGSEALRRAAAAGDRCVVFDVPLLVESAHWRDRVDRVLVVDCSDATQIARVTRRAGWTAAAVQRVISTQAPRAQRRACADAVIFNDGIDAAGLAAEVSALAGAWRVG
jgi:dephospho-CoA kinase